MNKNFDHILAVSQWQRNEYAGFEAVELWKSESGRTWNYKKYTDGPKYAPPTIGIRLYCQCNLDRDDRRMYALSVKISGDINMSELEQARADVARLTKIEKKYTELCNKFGYPTTFTQFAAYISEIIGAELAEHSSANDDYCHMDIETLKYRENKITHPNE